MVIAKNLNNELYKDNFIDNDKLTQYDKSHSVECNSKDKQFQNENINKNDKKLTNLDEFSQKTSKIKKRY